jgi:hypothetical protein
MRSDEDQGGSDRQCRLIQPFRHQIQLLTTRPAPAEPDQYVARLECLVNGLELLSNRAPSVKTFLAKQISALTAAMAQCGLAAAER